MARIDVPRSSGTSGAAFGSAPLVGGGSTYLGLPGVRFTGTTGTRTVQANSYLYYPFLVEEPINVNQLSIEVTATGAGTARLGIATADATWQPVALVGQGASTIDLSSTGHKPLAVDLDLTPGRHVAIYHGSITATLLNYRGTGPFAAVPPAMGGNVAGRLRVSVGSYGAIADPPSDWDAVDPYSTGFEYTTMLRWTVA